MKRYGNLYTKIYGIDNLRIAHKNAKKGKGWYKEVKMVDENPDHYLYKLQDMLINKTYQTSEYEIFIKNDSGKEREIYKLPYYPDRICQWAIMQVIEPILTKKLINNTFSAIPNRGIHLALKRITADIKNDRAGTEYCLKIDIKKYYPNINHTILKQTYRKIFKDKDLLWLLDEIIDSTDGETGIPIGNYLSQWSSNIYLSEFDHWIKEEKHIKYYYRYMDDMVILHHDKSILHKLKDEIDGYFDFNLKLKIKENWQVFPTFKRGIDFVGYRIFDKYILLRKSTSKKFKKKMRKIDKKDKIGFHEYASINSYNGWFKWGNCHNLESKYIGKLEDKITDYEHEKEVKKSLNRRRKYGEKYNELIQFLNNTDSTNFIEGGDIYVSIPQ